MVQENTRRRILLKNRAVLITRIRQDIASRNLSPGDHYLTTREAAKHFDVSPMTAGRALQELAKQGVLDRKPGAGTVLRSLEGSPSTELRQIHIVTPEAMYKSNTRVFGGIMGGIHRVLPFDTVQLTFLPQGDGADMLHRFADLSGNGEVRTGFVLVLCSPATLELFAQAGVAAVVAGSTYPHAHAFPYVNRDGYAAGKMLADFMFEQGHERLGILMPDHWNFGDGQYFDGILAAAQEADLRPNSLTVRTTPAQQDLAAGALRDMIDQDNAPTGFICHSSDLAQFAHDVLLEEIGPKNGICRVATPDNHNCPPGAAFLRFSMDSEDFGEHLGRLLRDVLDGKEPSPSFYLSTPVGIEWPSGAEH
jgi:DNA-binding LacI/PurR family transcriptional regulator